jgi:hypothetical protein
MKITIDIDCTPGEARAFLGLPDVAPLQAEVMGTAGAHDEDARKHGCGKADEDLAVERAQSSSRCSARFGSIRPRRVQEPGSAS